MLRILRPAGALVLLLAPAGYTGPEPILALFLGDKGHHQPAELHKVLAPDLETRGIRLTYTEDTLVLAPGPLAGYDILFLYNNLATLSPRRADALIDFVEGGKGLVVSHCGITVSRTYQRLDTLFGGRFASHGGEVFRTDAVLPEHPAVKGTQGFESWDETYVHNHVEPGRTVLRVRRSPGATEPWAWALERGQGRVYYNASGHDFRAWAMPAFRGQLAAGIRWAARRDGSTAVLRAARGPRGNLRVSLSGRGGEPIAWRVALPGVDGREAARELRGRVLPAPLSP